MANPDTIVQLVGDPYRPWNATSLEAWLGVDHADLRFVGGGALTPLRLFANGDVRLYGELLLDDGAVRASDTIALTVYDSNDIVSFRSGSGAGDELLRIDVDGAICGAAESTLVLKSYVSTGSTPGVKIDSDTALASDQPLLRIDSAGSTKITMSSEACRFWSANDYKLLAKSTSGLHQLQVHGKTVEIGADDGSDVARWGLFSTDSSDQTRELTINDGGATPTEQALKIDAETITFQVHNSYGPIEWGSLYASSNTRQLTVPQHAQFNFKAGDNFYDLRIVASAFRLRLHPSEFIIEDASENERMKVTTSGDLLLTSPSTASAQVVVDSTAATGAKKWEMASVHTGGAKGNLRFTNLTDQGTPYVDFTPGGSVYSSEFIGASPVTSAPSDGEGELGAVVVDTTNKRVWAKVKDTGSDRWWYASLTDPGA